MAIKDCQKTPQTQSSEKNLNTPKNQKNKDTPKNKKNQGTPKYQKNQGTPKNQKNQGSPKNQINQGTPKNQKNQGTPKNQKNQGTPKNQKNQGSQKSYSKKPLFKQVLTSPLTAQWPQVSDATIAQIRNEFSRSAQNLRKKVELKPQWKDLRNIKKDDRKSHLERHRQDAIAAMEAEERQKFLEEQTIKSEKLNEIVMGYNAIMRQLRVGSLAALIINSSATPPFIPMSFLPTCYLRNIPVVALPDLQDVFGKCIGVGFKKSIQQDVSHFHGLYILMRKAFGEVEANLKTPTISDEENDMSAKKDIAYKKPDPPPVDISRFHITRGSSEQIGFLAELTGKQWTEDFVSLSSNIPTSAPSEKFLFPYRKVNNKPKPKKKSEGFLGKEITDEKPSNVNLEEKCSDLIFELDFGNDVIEDNNPALTDAPPQVGENLASTVGSLAKVDDNSEKPVMRKNADSASSLTLIKPGSTSSISVTSKEKQSGNSQTGSGGNKSSAVGAMKSSDQPARKKQRGGLKRKASIVEEKLTGAVSYVPAAVKKVIGNAKRKKTDKS